MISFNQNFGELGIEVAHYMPDDGSGVYAKGVYIPEGRVLRQHAHEFTHKTIIAFGILSVHYADRIEVHEGPDVLVIEAGVQHEFVLWVNSWACCLSTLPSGM